MRSVDFVLYTSKLCNLRCSYCYELPLLAERARITHEQLTRLFAHVRSFVDGEGEPVLVRFQWHGGEPLLIPPEYYWRAFELCRNAFSGSQHMVHHTVQSNFTVLDDARLALLKGGFDAVGVSLDVHSGLRVDKGGVDQEHRTVENLDRALASGLRPQGITVLSRATVERIPEVYAFYSERGMGFRLLPLEKGLYESGQPFEVTSAHVLSALCEAADLWFADDHAVRVEPIAHHIRLLVAARSRPDSLSRYDKIEWEPVLQVDTDGTLFGYTNFFDSSRALGNVFDAPLETILGGGVHAAAADAARERVRRTCTDCRFHGRGCTSYPISESDVSFLDTGSDGALQCSVFRPLLAHLDRKLTEAGVFDEHGRVTPALRAEWGTREPAPEA